MKKLSVSLSFGPHDSIPVGELADTGREVFFEFAESFVDASLPISPYHLPVRKGLHSEKTNLHHGLFGLFDDSLPDGWGLMLMKRAFAKAGIDINASSPLDWLAYMGGRAMGALVYSPENRWGLSKSGPLKLGAMADHVNAILEGNAREILPQMIQAGGSPGGARPKILIGYDGKKLISDHGQLSDELETYQPWLLKFFSKNESVANGKIEFIYSLIAKAAGLEMPETTLLETDDNRFFFATKRFDRVREGKSIRRLHLHSYAGLIHCNFRTPDQDYNSVLEVCFDLTRNYEDLIRCFRQMVFNVVGHNRDDHAKNFAFLMDHDGSWRLSPAFDLTFSYGPSGLHTTTVDGAEKDVKIDDCLRVGKKIGIDECEIKIIIDQVNTAFSDFRKLATEHDVNKEDIEVIQTQLQFL